MRCLTDGTRDFLLSLCLVVLGEQSWRRLWGRQGERKWRDKSEGRRWEVAWSRTYVSGQREEADNRIFR